MDKEARERLAQVLAGSGTVMNSHRLMANIIHNAGYRKLPEDKPPLLSDEDWEKINKKTGIDVIDIALNLDNRYTPIKQANLIVERCNLTAQAQREADINHYENV